MADIDIERKKKSPFPWILGLLGLALLAFLLMRSCGDDEAEPAVAPVTDTTTATAAPVAPITDTTTVGAAGAGAGAAAAGAAGAAGAGWIGTVLAGTNAGQTAGGSAMVPATPSDRGFWLEENGQRVYAVLSEPNEQMRDIDPGQRVTISNARVLRGSEASQIPQDVEAETRTTAQGQSYFLLVPSSGVQITAGGNTTSN